MSAIQIVIHKLVGNAGVTNITTVNKLFPVQAPQNTDAPYIAVNLVSGRDEHMLQGDGGYYRSRVSVECIGLTAAVVLDLGDAVIEALGSTLKQAFLSFKDVDITFADVDITQPNDSQTACQRILHYFVQWRRA
jgi:hypothetical protein